MPYITGPHILQIGSQNLREVYRSDLSREYQHASQIP